MPLAAPARPRKMFPPPMTMQTSVPARAASFTSAAMRSTVPVSMPNASDPMRASPETFNITRRYFGVVLIAPPEVNSRSAARHLFDFFGEVRGHLLDAFTDLIAHEAFNLDRRAHFLGGLFDHFGNRCLVVE